LGKGIRKRKYILGDRYSKYGVLMILPALVVLFIFRLYPIISAIQTSFFSWNLIGSKNFVGISNFLRLFSDWHFYKAFGVSLYYAVLTIPAVIIISLVLAVLIDRVVFLRGFFRAAYFAPFILCLAVVSIIWKAMYHPGIGLLGMSLRALGREPLHILTSDRLVVPGLALIGIWRYIGFYMIIFLAGLQIIPNSTLEAARMDGASSPQIFFKITLPLLKPTLFMVLVLATIRNFQIFSMIFVITKGGPADASRTIVYYIWEKGFNELEMGYALSITVVLLVILLVTSRTYQLFLERD